MLVKKAVMLVKLQMWFYDDDAAEPIVEANIIVNTEANTVPNTVAHTTVNTVGKKEEVTLWN